MDITGRCGRFLFIHPWTQFYKPGNRPDMPRSRCNNIIMRGIRVETPTLFDVQPGDNYDLADFFFEGSLLRVER